ncbi:hypothetical protein EKG36_08370 [Halomonas nitroreducens]|uniref:Phosphotransferase n=1 Tax=Halomonas nitroreducens TaxID=447425 RepID=A0A431V6Q6_9GAMM|nr:hypothetical protein EKG36_08370 [Halomonas nitroreducens]
MPGTTKCATPAAPARSSTASRSASKSGKSRWQWASINIGWKLEAGSWKLEAGSWKLEAGSWKLEASLNPPQTASRVFLPASSSSPRSGRASSSRAQPGQCSRVWLKRISGQRSWVICRLTRVGAI